MIFAKGIKLYPFVFFGFDKKLASYQNQRQPFPTFLILSSSPKIQEIRNHYTFSSFI